MITLPPYPLLPSLKHSTPEGLVPLTRAAAYQGPGRWREGLVGGTIKRGRHRFKVQDSLVQGS